MSKSAVPEVSAREAELVEHRDVVAAGPVLGDLPVLYAVDVDLLDLEPALGRWLSEEVALVGAAYRAAQRDAVAVAEHVVDLVVQVGEMLPVASVRFP